MVLFALKSHVDQWQRVTIFLCMYSGKKLLEEVAKLVPKHTGRQKKAAEPATGGGSSSGGKSGKSGKKKK
jgi:hypothetical protein